MSTVVMTRRNGATNPKAVTSTSGFGSYISGVSETGTTTLVSGAADGPLPGVSTYARWTVTTPKTGGSTGWRASGSPYLNALSGLSGSKVTVSIYVRYTGSAGSTVGVMRSLVLDASAVQINSQDSAAQTLLSGAWTRVSSTITAAADFASVGWWFYQTSGYPLPAGATLDAVCVLSEPGAALGTYFDGDTPAATDAAGYSPPAQITYAWAGAQNASASTMTEVAPLQDYQLQLPDGTATGAGCPVGFTEVTNLRGSGALRDSDLDTPDGDGALPGLSYVGAKTVGITFSLVAPAGGLEAALAVLTRNWQNVSDPGSKPLKAGQYLAAIAAGLSPSSALQFQLPGRAVPLLAIGRPGKLDLPVNLDYQYHKVEVPAEWRVPDGLIYDATVNVSSCNLPQASAAAAFPLTFPVSWGKSSNNTVQAANAGNYPAQPVFVITGPATTPRITNAATGEYLRLNLTLAAGDTVVINTQARTVKLNGANRNNAVDVGSTFFTIPQGGLSLGFASQGTGSEAGQLTVYTLNTYSTV